MRRGKEKGKGRERGRGSRAGKGRSKNWIQKAIKRPGRVRRYLKRKYGDKAFTKTGEIKQQYLYKAKKDLQNSKMPKEKKRSLISAINLAIRLEKMRKDRR